MRLVAQAEATTTISNAALSAKLEACALTIAESMPASGPHPRSISLYLIARSGRARLNPEELADIPAPRSKNQTALADDLATIRNAARSVRTGRSPAEAEFLRSAVAVRWHAVKRGWPDFFMVDDDGRLAAVEVKRTRGRTLKALQRACMRMLARCGVPCFRWSPDAGYERIGLIDPSQALQQKATTGGI